ncbi:MAG: immunoglobulin domain-containing protein [Verrucomicrobia bacterium]|nr:immunoglobulin domain-containing protein [Verrucomicrobiota bacterium]
MRMPAGLPQISLVVASLLLSAPPDARAQDGALDIAFDPGNGVRYMPILRSLVDQPDGKFLVFGDFDSLNGIRFPSIARLTADGSLDPMFVPEAVNRPRVQGQIRAAAVLPDGRILIGGNFVVYGASSGDFRYNLARLTANGAVDLTLNNTFISGVINALAQQSDGKILVGGQNLTVLNRTNLYCLVRLTANGAVDNTYSQRVGGNGSVHFIDINTNNAANPNSSRIGGILPALDGSVTNYLISLKVDGSVDSTYGGAGAVNGAVARTASQADGRLLLAGFFTQAAGTSWNRVVRLTSAGTPDASFAIGTGADGETLAIAVQSGGKILLAGGFTSFNGVPCGGITRLNSDGSIDGTFNPGSGANDRIYQMQLRPNGELLLLGAFSAFNGSARGGMARLNSDGSLLASLAGLTPASLTRCGVYATAVQPDGRILIGGDFNAVRGRNLPGIARLNPDGTLDASFRPGVGVDGQVQNIAIEAEGRILLAGAFRAVQGAVRTSLARLQPEGSLDLSFAPTLLKLDGTPGSLSRAIPLSNGQALIGGHFRSLNGASRSYFARVNSDGSGDSSFDAQIIIQGRDPLNPSRILTGQSPTVEAIAPQPDGRIVIGGYVTWDGLARGYLMRLNSNGQMDTNFIPTSVASNVVITAGTVRDVTLLANAKILACGGFAEIITPGFIRPRRGGIVRFEANGQLDVSFDTGLGANGEVRALALQSDDKIVIGGEFQRYNLPDVSMPNNRIRVARLNANGSLDETFQPGTGANDTVNMVIWLPTGRALIGGVFTNYNGAMRPGLARVIAQSLTSSSNTPPVVSLIAVGLNSETTFTAPATIVLGADAKDADGTVSKVEFFAGTTKLGEDTVAPYSFGWMNVPAGTYSLSAKATDNQGATTTSTEIKITVNAAVPVSPPPGLIGWWPGDRNNSNLVVTIQAASGQVSFVDGKVGQAFNFASDSDRISIPHDSLFDVQAPGFTVEFWMRGIKNQPQNYYLVVDKSHGWIDSTGWAFQGDSSSGKISFSIGAGGGGPAANFTGVASTADVLDGVFHHLAGTWDGNTVRLYVDRSLQSEAPLSTPANNTRPVNVGYSWGGGSPNRFFRGQVDELSIYRRALSSNEVAAIFTAGSAGKSKLNPQTLPPVIVSSPQNQTVPAGSAVTFTVTASGSAPLVFQWMKDGTVIAGATNATFTLTNAQAADTGSYTVAVSNTIGGVNSSPATLTVIGTPQTPVALKIRAINIGAIVSWPATALNYVLQSADHLPAAGWQAVTNSPVVVGNELTILIEAGPAQRFYRLQKTSDANPAVDETRVSASPSAVTLTPAARQTFVATVTGAQNAGVLWSVKEGAAGGVINAQGGYTAPDGPGFFHVVATSLADPSKSAMALVFVTDAPATSDYYPQPVVPGSTTDESKSITTTTGQLASLSLSDGTKLEIPAWSAPVTVTLTRTSNTLDLGGALQQTSGSMRFVTYSGDITNTEFAPLITFPAKEAGSLKAVNIARVSDLITVDGVLKNQIIFLPAQEDASGNLRARDVFLQSSAPAAVTTLGNAQPSTQTTVTVLYSVSTYQGNPNYSVQPQLVRMIPDATDRAPLSRYPKPAQDEILRKPVQNVVLLVHGHNEAERYGFETPEVGEPWLFSYKRDVWHFLYQEFQAKYPEYVNCTAFYEYIYPTYRPIFGETRWSLGYDLARLAESDPTLKAMKQKYHLFVIAHSMGGLVARAGLNQMDTSITDNLDKLVTWGTPHHGSPLVTFRFLLTAGYDVDISGLCILSFGRFGVPVRVPVSSVRELAFAKKKVQSLAVDTPGERELRWDNSKPLNLEGVGWRRASWMSDDARYGLALNPELYNQTLLRFNIQDKFRLSDKYAAFYGITSQSVDADFSCLGIKRLVDAAEIAQGNFFIHWLYNNPTVLTDYPIQPSVKDNDGAVPVDSMVGAGIIPVLNTRHLGDVDHEQYFGSSAGPGTVDRTFVMLKVRDTETKRCDCPSLAVTQIQPTSSAAQVTGKVIWPGDPKPGQRVLRIAAAQGQGSSRILTAALSFTIQDDGNFTAFFDTAVLNTVTAGQATVILAQMKDGAELPADVSISPVAVTLSPRSSQGFIATVSASTNPVVIWSVLQGIAGGTITSSGLYTAPATNGTYHVVAVSQADPTKSGTATVTVTQQVSIAISPSSVTIAPNATQNFTVTVTGTDDITWSVQEGVAGGRIAPITATNILQGVYTAPATPGTYHIIVTTWPNTNRSATATVTVSALQYHTLFFGDGTLREDWWTNEQGRREGTWKTYWQSGGVNIERHYVDGVIHGPFITYFENGVKASESNWVNGVMSGLSTTWWGNGQKRSEGTVVNGELNGLFTEWDFGDFNGTLAVFKAREFTYRDGKRNGPFIAYSKNGTQSVTGNYVDDQQEGLFTYFSATTGAKSLEQTYVKGQLDGTEIGWYGDGVKEHEGAYTMGRKTGRWTYYKTDGSVDRVEDYP